MLGELILQGIDAQRLCSVDGHFDLISRGAGLQYFWTVRRCDKIPA